MQGWQVHAAGSLGVFLVPADFLLAPTFVPFLAAVFLAAGAFTSSTGAAGASATVGSTAGAAAAVSVIVCSQQRQKIFTECVTHCQFFRDFQPIFSPNKRPGNALPGS